MTDNLTTHREKRAATEARVTASPFHRRHDGAALDYEESEGLEFLAGRPVMNWHGIVNALAITGLFVAAGVGFAVIFG